MFGMTWLRSTIGTLVALIVMLYSAVIVRMVKYKHEQKNQSDFEGFIGYIIGTGDM